MFRSCNTKSCVADQLSGSYSDMQVATRLSCWDMVLEASLRRDGLLKATKKNLRSMAWSNIEGRSSFSNMFLKALHAYCKVGCE